MASRRNTLREQPLRGFLRSIELALLFIAHWMECKIGRGQSGGKLMAGVGELIQVIDLLEATPGIEPGYTVLQTVA